MIAGTDVRRADLHRCQEQSGQNLAILRGKRRISIAVAWPRHLDRAKAHPLANRVAAFVERVEADQIAEAIGPGDDVVGTRGSADGDRYVGADDDGCSGWPGAARTERRVVRARVGAS